MRSGANPHAHLATACWPHCFPLLCPMQFGFYRIGKRVTIDAKGNCILRPR